MAITEENSPLPVPDEKRSDAIDSATKENPPAPPVFLNQLVHEYMKLKGASYAAYCFEKDVGLSKSSAQGTCKTSVIFV
ncbi:hypothetical protein ACHQM5_025908 [Ranunculus cassubicifolius]